MPRPKVVRSGGCRQASKEAGNGAGKRGSVNQASYSGNEIPRCQPVRRHSQTPLRLIGRAQAVHAPEFFGQQHVAEALALAPPVVPRARTYSAGPLAAAGGSPLKKPLTPSKRACHASKESVPSRRWGSTSATRCMAQTFCL